MAANTLAYTYAELRRWVGREIGKSRDPTSPAWDSTTTLDVADFIKAGQHNVYSPKIGDVPNIWRFLPATWASLTINPAYTTGTVAISSTTVTGTSTVFPTWAASGEIFVSEGWYTIASRNSGTSLTLDSAVSSTVSAGTSYSLIQREYDLPDDFGGLVEPFSYRRDDTLYGGRQLTTVNEAIIRSMDSRLHEAAVPQFAAIIPVAPTTSTDLRWRVIFDTIPDDSYQLWYRYNVLPPILDGTTYVYAYVPAFLMDVLRLSCLTEALKGIYRDYSKEQEFQNALRSAVAIDKRLNRPSTYGFGAYSDGYARDGYFYDRDAARRNSTFTITG